MIAPTAAMKMTAAAGTRRLLTRLQIRQPGIAPSRLNAKHIRDALVRQAAPQNSWPTVQMTITILNQLEVRASDMIATDTYWPAAACSLIESTFWTANVSASSTTQPKIAE